jgi:hypothetical protein
MESPMTIAVIHLLLVRWVPLTRTLLLM